MTIPLTPAEVTDATDRLRVERPLHWTLARRLLGEVLRLRPELRAQAGLQTPSSSVRPPNDPLAPPAPIDEEPVTSP